MKNKVCGVVSPERCCSCGACARVCPRGALEIVCADGNFVPSVNRSLCTECGLCRTVCPCGDGAAGLREPVDAQPIASYAVYARNDDIRRRSTSGGFVTQLILTLLAQGTYQKAYVVDDDSFSGMQAVLKPVTTREGVLAAVKSKYIPVSVMRILDDVRNGTVARSIIVCTPCQQVAIRRFMARCQIPEDDVLFVGLFCGTMMNYGVYGRYERDYGKYDRILFRDKDAGGWPGDTTLISGERRQEISHRVRWAYARDYPVSACAECRDKLNVRADISVGDCYVSGYSRMDGDGGLSSVVVRSVKGQAAFEVCRGDFVVEDCAYEDIWRSQRLEPRATRGARIRKVYVLLDIYDFTNRGDWMMLEAMLEQVKGRIPRFVPVISRQAYDQQPRWCAEHGLAPLGGGRFYGLLKPRKLKRQVPPHLIDIVLFSPGFRFSDKVSAGCQADYYREYFAKFTKRGRRIYFLPQAFGPFETPAARDCMREVFPIPDRIYARDEESLRFMTALVGESSRVSLCPDFTCLFHGERHPIPFPIRGYVVLIPNYNMVEATDRETGARYEDFMVAIGDRLSEQGERVVLLNHEGEWDERLAMRINARLAVPAYLATRLTGGECKSVISGAKLVVSSRFHGVVSGLTDGVPTLCTSWSHKYGELIRELGCPDNCLDVLDPQGSMKKVEAALSSPGRYAPQPETLEELRHRVYRMWREILG